MPIYGPVTNTLWHEMSLLRFFSDHTLGAYRYINSTLFLDVWQGHPKDRDDLPARSTKGSSDSWGFVDGSVSVRAMRPS